MGLCFLLVLVVLRGVLRRIWLAAAAVAILVSLAYGGAPTGLTFWLTAVFYSMFMFILPRFGMVSAMAFALVYELMLSSPFTRDFSRWYAWQGICAMLVLAALSAYAFWTNLGGRALWRDEEDARPA
jgi:hypothetical protein